MNNLEWALALISFLVLMSFLLRTYFQVEIWEYDNRIEYRLKGKRHRLDGPAAEYANGDKHWYVKGLRHRLDGPAVELADGRVEFWNNGTCRWR